MKINKSKMQLAMARACMEVSDIAKKAEMPLPTVKKTYAGMNVRASTVGKIARALGVDVLDIIEQEEEHCE